MNQGGKAMTLSSYCLQADRYANVWAALLGLSHSVHAEHEALPQPVRASFDAYMNTSSDWDERWSLVLLATRDDLVLDANADGKVYVEANYRLTCLVLQLHFGAEWTRFS